MTEPSTQFARKRHPALQGLRIVVVEDDRDSREMLEELLRYEGAEVEAAGDATSGLAAVVRSRPDVLLSDIGLPGEDGWSLLRRCRDLTPSGERTPAIAITALMSPEDRARSLAAGFDEHVCKPLNFNQLVQKILNFTGRN